MLLISAMRLGALQGPIQDVLMRTADRRDKTLQWANGRGKSPVLCGFGTGEQLVIVDKPAMVDQLCDTVSHAGLLSGILKRILPHDLRRGSAKDIAKLPQDPTEATGLATDVVAAQLGHCNVTLSNGTTGKYVDGASTHGIWSKRVNASLQDPFGPDVASIVYKKPTITRDEWLSMYKAGMDSFDRKATRKFRDETHKKNEQQWITSEGEASSSRPGKRQSFLHSNSTSNLFIPALSSQSTSQINVGANLRKRKAKVLLASTQIGATKSPNPIESPGDIELRKKRGKGKPLSEPTNISTNPTKGFEDVGASKHKGKGKVLLETDPSDSPNLSLNPIESLNDIDSCIDPRLRESVTTLTQVVGDVDREEV
jgi:hypothetical protein